MLVFGKVRPRFTKAKRNFLEKQQTKVWNKYKLLNPSGCLGVTPVSRDNGIACSSVQDLQFSFIFGEYSSLAVLDRPVFGRCLYSW